MELKAIIGDYEAFFSDLLARLTAAGIDINGRPITHLLYRSETMAEYEKARVQLKPLSAKFVETYFNGRPVSVFVLKKTLRLTKEYSVSMVELPAPHPDHMYAPGLENFGVMVGHELAAFKQRYQDVLTGAKKYAPFNQPAYITFENGKTVRFYDHTLEEIILLEGWRFEQPGEPADAAVNQVAGMVNAWRRYLYQAPGWQELIKNVEPKQTGCGPVYEIPNPIDRPNESFAIADMRGYPATDAHYHHEMTEVYMVLEGSGTVVVGGEAQAVQKDTTVVIPPDTAHFTLSDGLVLAAINTPPFEAEDYLVLEESNEAVKFDKAQYDQMTKEARHG